MIGEPLDGTKNPKTTKLGDDLKDITGIVTQAFGTYRILPLTALNVTGSATPEVAPVTAFTSGGSCSKITVGSYNVENLTPKSSYLPSIASHIANYLKTPDIVFLQEIQDDNGATNNGGLCYSTTNSFLQLTDDYSCFFKPDPLNPYHIHCQPIRRHLCFNLYFPRQPRRRW